MLSEILEVGRHMDNRSGIRPDFWNRTREVLRNDATFKLDKVLEYYCNCLSHFDESSNTDNIVHQIESQISQEDAVVESII